MPIKCNTAPDIAALAVGWIVLGRAPKRKDMEWPQWEPMGEADWAGQQCLIRRNHCTMYPTFKRAENAVRNIGEQSRKAKLDWHRNTEFSIVPVLLQGMDVPDKGV